MALSIPFKIPVKPVAASREELLEPCAEALGLNFQGVGWAHGR